MEAADAITSHTAKTRRINVFKSKQTRKKVPPNMFRSFKLRTKVQLMS